MDAMVVGDAGVQQNSDQMCVQVFLVFVTSDEVAGVIRHQDRST